MKIGITSTIPVECVFAAGGIPVDLNNLFISDAYPAHYIALAEQAGFPASFCAWVKGLYGVIHEQDIRRIIVVTEGDCSNNAKLAELLVADNRDVFCFAYPQIEHLKRMRQEMTRLMQWLGCDEASVSATKVRLDDRG